ncbi:SpoIIE family protein phosphatase [Blastococcus saxobsidens]|uniref:Serine phosphatase RsbU (Regulator of sigma subunit) n=1 Tax=Blastococcus saxobsidens TaxID=138336 RepID=A0A4Q7Y6M1_9ACTN|nr:SpoIIE family protein phosphatase [Blastococcus saxobsidens]RZU31585.1 serine phosphatase RsbU (regulator of sigma subunit) [Blastococcus saxobsidens]
MGEGSPGRPVVEEQLRDLALLRAAVEGGLDGMVVVSADGVMIASNRKFQEIWPIPPEIVASGDDDAALASVLDKLVDPDSFLPRVHELYAQAAGSARDELLLLDGRVLDRYGTALRGPQGDYIGWAWYFRDVTADRAAAVDAERLRALVAVARALADARSELDVLSVVSGRGASVLGAQGAALCLTEPDRASVRILGTTFFEEDLRADVATLPADAPLPIVHVAATGESLFLADRAEGLRQFPGALEVYVRARTEATAAVPLTTHGTAIGALAVAFQDRKSWREADKVLMSALAALTALALDRLAAQGAEREAVRHIRRLSETLQRSLLTALPQSGRVQIAARYQPAARDAEVGGDWYDAFSTADGSTNLVVGDVAGHDSTAAAAMAQVRNVLRGVAQTVQASPAGILSALDGALDRLRMTTLATAVLCQVHPVPEEPDRSALRLRWSNAGHPPPLLLHADGSCELLADGPADVLLGAHVEGRRTDHEVGMPPGSTLVLYTDGLVERRNRLLDDGIAALRRAAEELHGLPVEELCDRLVARLGAEGEDDVVLLVARVVG